jgi:hypothetical protein
MLRSLLFLSLPLVAQEANGPNLDGVPKLPFDRVQIKIAQEVVTCGLWTPAAR